MSTNFFRKMTSARATRASLEDDKSRTGLPQDINQALVTSPPIGAMVEWGGDSDPPGGIWIIADGRVLEQAAYPDLFAVYGARWNTGGEAATQFRTPDRRGRVGVGAGQGSGLTNRTLAGTFGEENHSLSQGEMPSHGHSTSTDSHSHSGFYSEAFNYANGTAHDAVFDISSSSGTNSYSTASTSHSHTVNNAGSGSSHNNMQPSISVNFILRVL